MPAFAGMTKAMNEPRLNLPELTVSELSTALKRTIEEAYGYVRVRGELGNVKYHSSGHIYLDLKDDRACIAGIIWRTAAPRIKLKLEAGLEVVVTGRLTTVRSGQGSSVKPSAKRATSRSLLFIEWSPGAAGSARLGGL